jgi:hypothetical protein
LRGTWIDTGQARGGTPLRMQNTANAERRVRRDHPIHPILHSLVVPAPLAKYWSDDVDAVDGGEPILDRWVTFHIPDLCPDTRGHSIPSSNHMSTHVPPAHWVVHTHMGSRVRVPALGTDTGVERGNGWPGFTIHRSQISHRSCLTCAASCDGWGRVKRRPRAHLYSFRGPNFPSTLMDHHSHSTIFPTMMTFPSTDPRFYS